jgi:hypothetical protein
MQGHIFITSRSAVVTFQHWGYIAYMHLLYAERLLHGMFEMQVKKGNERVDLSRDSNGKFFFAWTGKGKFPRRTHQVKARAALFELDMQWLRGSIDLELVNSSINHKLSFQFIIEACQLLDLIPVWSFHRSNSS